MFSSRQELDAEIEKLQNDVLFAQEEDPDISALEKGIEAERRLARLKLLRRDQKFRAIQDMKEEIKFLSMDLQQVSSLRTGCPLSRRSTLCWNRLVQMKYVLLMNQMCEANKMHNR